MDILDSLFVAIFWPDLVAGLSDRAGEMTAAVFASMVSRNVGKLQIPRLRYLVDIAAEALT